MPDRFPTVRPTRHDLLLAAIATPLVVAGAVAATSAVQVEYALAAGAIPAGGGLYYALFGRPPVSTGE